MASPRERKKERQAYFGGAVPRHLKEQIELAAKYNGRSIITECRERLERSFKTHPAERPPPELEAFIELIGRIMVKVGEGINTANQITGHSAPANWTDDPYTWNQALLAAHYVLERVGFKDSPEEGAAAAPAAARR